MAFSDSVLRVSIAAFDGASSLTNFFVIPAAIGRIGYLNVSGSGSDDYTRVAKGVVLYFVLIFAFEPILRLLLTIPADLLPNFNFGANAATGVDPNSLGDHARSIFPNILSWTFESLVIVLYYAAEFLNYVVAIVMSSMAPVVFLLGGVLNIGLGVGTFMSLLTVLCCWPIVFTACEAMRHVINGQEISIVGGFVSEVLIGFCKLVGPIAMAKSAMKSPVGQAMKAVVSAGANTAAGGLTHTKAFRLGTNGKEFSHQPRSFSQMASNQPTQLAHVAGSKLRELSIKKALSGQPEQMKHNSFRARFTKSNGTST